MALRRSNEVINVDRLNSTLDAHGIAAFNHWHIQDLFLVTDDGRQLVSNKFNTDELFSCKG
jgi:hypothetical protein